MLRDFVSKIKYIQDRIQLDNVVKDIFDISAYYNPSTNTIIEIDNVSELWDDNLILKYDTWLRVTNNLDENEIWFQNNC